MKAKDLLQITAVATGTATLTVATFLASPLDAGSEADTIGATVPNPKLVSRDVEFTVVPVEGCELKAGNQPEFELQAVNTLDTPSEVAVRLTMTGSTPVSPMSRMMPMPSLLWQHESRLTLRAKETRSMHLLTQTHLPENTVVSVVLKDIDPQEEPMESDSVAVEGMPQLIPVMGNGVVALSFSTAEPMANPMFAAAP